MKAVVRRCSLRNTCTSVIVSGCPVSAPRSPPPPRLPRLPLLVRVRVLVRMRAWLFLLHYRSLATTGAPCCSACPCGQSCMRAWPDLYMQMQQSMQTAMPTTVGGTAGRRLTPMTTTGDPPSPLTRPRWPSSKRAHCCGYPSLPASTTDRSYLGPICWRFRTARSAKRRPTCARGS